jgi:hypothetical protein
MKKNIVATKQQKQRLSTHLDRDGLKWLVIFAHAPTIQLLETTQVTKLPVSIAKLNFCGGVPSVIGTATSQDT